MAHGVIHSPAISPTIHGPHHGPLKAANRTVFIAGQSNGIGKAVASNITLLSNPTTPYANVKLYSQIALNQDPPTYVTEPAWESLQPRTLQLGGASYPVGTCGAELSMGRQLDQAAIGTWSIAKLAIDGSGLQDNWISATYPTNGTKLKQQLLDFMTARLSERGSSVGAFVWIQGENDAGNSPQNTNYYTNLGTLFGAVQAQFGHQFPIIIHRLSDKNQGIASCTIRSAEESYAVVNSGVYISTADDIALRDGAHYVDDGYVTIGNRIATLIQNYWTNQTTVPNPVWRATGVLQHGNSAAVLSPPWPTGHQSGDIGLLCLVGIGNNNYSLSPDGGFVELPSSPQHDGSSSLNARLHVWWCRATSSSMPTPTITNAASSDAKIACIVTFRGCTASGNPWDVTSGSTPASGTAVVVPGNTTTAANRLVVSINGAKITSTADQVDPFANADLTSLFEQFDYTTNFGAGGNLWIATGVKAAAGAYTTTTGTLATSTLQSQAAITLALKP